MQEMQQVLEKERKESKIAQEKLFERMLVMQQQQQLQQQKYAATSRVDETKILKTATASEEKMQGPPAAAEQQQHQRQHQHQQELPPVNAPRPDSDSLADLYSNEADIDIVQQSIKAILGRETSATAREKKVEIIKAAV